MFSIMKCTHARTHGERWWVEASLHSLSVDWSSRLVFSCHITELLHLRWSSLRWLWLILPHLSHQVNIHIILFLKCKIDLILLFLVLYSLLALNLFYVCIDLWLMERVWLDLKFRNEWYFPMIKLKNHYNAQYNATIFIAAVVKILLKFGVCLGSCNTFKRLCSLLYNRKVQSSSWNHLIDTFPQHQRLHGNN